MVPITAPCIPNTCNFFIVFGGQEAWEYFLLWDPDWCKGDRGGKPIRFPTDCRLSMGCGQDLQPSSMYLWVPLHCHVPQTPPICGCILGPRPGIHPPLGHRLVQWWQRRCIHCVSYKCQAWYWTWTVLASIFHAFMGPITVPCIPNTANVWLDLGPRPGSAPSSATQIGARVVEEAHLLCLMVIGALVKDVVRTCNHSASIHGPHYRTMHPQYCQFFT